MVGTEPRCEMKDYDDSPRRDESDRYRIYAVSINSELHRIADCAGEAVTFTLETLIAEEQILPSERVGILDRLERVWLVNPFTRTSSHV
jgi:hypothetical protein